MTPSPFPALRSWYLAGQQVRVAPLLAGTASVLARSAFGQVRSAALVGDTAQFEHLPAGTYALEAWSAAGDLLGEEFTTVSSHPGENPVPGFVTSYRHYAVEPVLGWLRALRCTTVQFYDWMASYAAPLAATDSYADRLGHLHSLSAIKQLTTGCHEFGAVPQAYAPVYAVDPEYGEQHPGWLLYRNDGKPQRLGDLLQIADPGSADWQQHWLSAYGGAADALGFGGFHLDTYGYPRASLDRAGREVRTRAGYSEFLRVLRAARPGAMLSFNQVNGEPRNLPLAGQPGFRYVEVWPPNDRWRHLEGLLARSSVADEAGRAVLALYPPAWSGERSGALRTALLTEAVATMLGASLLVWGDDLGCLRHPYYPDYQRLSADEGDEALRWHRFALRCRDLFLGGTDTSWTDIGDENGAVAVGWRGAVLPEPAGGAPCARVVRHDGCIAVGVADLTGSPDGSWQQPTGLGRCNEVTVTVLLADPSRWTPAVAVLGQDGGMFRPASAVERVHREGRALEIRLPLAAGWSVLRLSRS
jgi:dextranase